MLIYFSLENNDSFLKSFFYKHLTKLSLIFSDLYTVASKCDKDFLTKKFKTNTIKVVPNWVNLNKKSYENIKLNKILMIGDLEKQKNYPLAFNFLKLVNEKIELDIYGSGSNIFLKSLSSESDLKVNFLKLITKI